MKWAKCNLGANVPEGTGLYFSWGNLNGHPLGTSYNFSSANYNETEGAAIDANLTLEQDAAHVTLGSKWRIPSNEEFQELYDNCTSEWTTVNGVSGRVFTSTINGQTIFIPACGLYIDETLRNRNNNGYCWSKSFVSENNAHNFGFNNSSVGPTGSNSRFYGIQIRPVFDPNL